MALRIDVYYLYACVYDGVYLKDFGKSTKTQWRFILSTLHGSSRRGSGTDFVAKESIFP